VYLWDKDCHECSGEGGSQSHGDAGPTSLGEGGSHSTEQGGATSISKQRFKGSTFASISLRGVHDRNKIHADGADSKSSSDQGSLQFDHFLDAQGSDEEDERKMQREGRRSRTSRVSYSALLNAATVNAEWSGHNLLETGSLLPA
jgi:hypothetical protein